MHARGLILVVLGASALACGTGASSSGSGGAGGHGVASKTSYYRDVKPIVDAKCAGCHVSGGIAPFALQSYDDAKKNAPGIKAAVSSKTMPPWPADDTCNTYQGDRSLSDAEIAAITGWVDDGAPEGDPKDEGPALDTSKVQKLSRVDRTLSIGTTYTPQIQPDDYHCFVVDWPGTQTEYVTGFRANPGEARVVHHVIAFLATPSDVATAQALDDAEPGPGYTCYGGPGFNSAGWLGAWAPGSLGSDYPAGTGVAVPTGSKVVIQVHYNTLTAGPLPDETKLDFELATQVAKVAKIQPWANPSWLKKGGMPIPAATQGVTHEWAFDPTTVFSGGKPLTVYASSLHMHQLGKSAKLAIARAGGGETCLLEIPKWNFHWQGMYGFEAPVTFNPGDQMALSCTWDNSTMQMVEWGEGTTDEMCLGLFYYTVD
jgi:hypothetical protein